MQGIPIVILEYLQFQLFQSCIPSSNFQDRTIEMKLLSLHNKVIEYPFETKPKTQKRHVIIK